MENTQMDLTDRSNQTPQTSIGGLSPQEQRILLDLNYTPMAGGIWMRLGGVDIVEQIRKDNKGYWYEYGSFDLMFGCRLYGIKMEFTKTIHETFWGAVELTKNDKFAD